MDPARFARGRAPRRRSGWRADRGRRAAARAGSASRIGPASSQTAAAALARSAPGTRGPVAGTAADRSAAGLSSAARAGSARAEHEALAERVGSETVGPVQPGAGGFADGEQPGQRAPAVEVGADAADQVVRGRGDRHEVGLPASIPSDSSVRVIVGNRSIGTGRRSRSTAPVPSAAIRSRIAAVTWSRGASSSVNRRPAASSSSAPSPRTASVISQPSSSAAGKRRARSGGTGRARGRRGRPRRRGRASHRRRSPPAGSWCAARGRRRRRWPAPSPPPGRAAIGEDAVAAPPVGPERERRGALEHLDPLVLGDQLARAGWSAPGRSRRPRRGRSGGPSARPRGRARARRRAAGRRRPRGRISASTAAGDSSTRTSTAAGSQRPRPALSVSSAWRAGESSGAIAAASPPWARKLARLGERLARDDDDPSRRPRPPRARRAAPRRRHRRRRRRRARWPSTGVGRSSARRRVPYPASDGPLLPPSRIVAPRHRARTPRTPAGSGRSRRRSRRRAGRASSSPEPPLAEREWLTRVHDPAPRRLDRGSLRGRWRGDRPRHDRRRRVVGGGAAGGRRRRRGGADACWRGSTTSRSAGCGRPAITPSRTGRWASACSTTPPSAPPTRSPSAAPSGS